MAADVLQNAQFKRDAGLRLRFFPRKQIPLYLQMEAAECGLACLAMVAEHYGVGSGLDELRVKFDVSVRGTSLQDLARIADQMGLNARCVELDANEIDQLRLPAVLHWEGNHWVVVKRVSGKGLELNDPAQGERWVGWAEVRAKFSGFAADFVPRAKLERTPPQPRLQFTTLLRSFPGLGAAVLRLFGVSVVLEIIALLMPYYTQIVIDHVLVTGDSDLLTIVALGTGFLLLLQTAFTAIRGWAGVVLSKNVGYQLYAHVIRHLFRLPITFFARRHVGDLVSRFDSLGQLTHTLTRASIEIALDVLVSLGTLTMMFWYSPSLTWIALATFVLMLTVKVIVFTSSNRIVSEKIFLEAKRNSHLIESMRGIHAVKMAQGEMLRSQQWISQTLRVIEKETATEAINLASNLAMTVTQGLAHIVVIYFAAQMILANQFSVGMLFAFIAFQGNFSGRAAAFADRVLWLRTMKVHFGRVSDITFAQIEPTVELHATKTAPPTACVLHVRNLGFRYSESDPYVFRNITLEVPAAKMVALVGPSGCGKTTLLCVIGGIFLPSEGLLAYDQENVTHSNAASLRKRVAFVFQNDELFEGSIEDNITFFEPQPDRIYAKRCADIAAISTEIEAFPQGYKTRLAEQGAGLSGGQRQRILIARALYRRPSLLVLDEATSQLDVATERLVLQNLKSLGITIIMSAHRPDAISLADLVYSVQAISWLQKLELAGG